MSVCKEPSNSDNIGPSWLLLSSVKIGLSESNGRPRRKCRYIIETKHYRQEYRDLDELCDKEGLTIAQVRSHLYRRRKGIDTYTVSDSGEIVRIYE